MERVGDADTAVVKGEAQHEVVVGGPAHHRGGLRLPALVRVVLRPPQELPPLLQRGEVPGDVHPARVAAAQPAPVCAALAGEEQTRARGLSWPPLRQWAFIICCLYRRSCDIRLELTATSLHFVTL